MPQCPGCQAPLRPNDKFCSECGKALPAADLPALPVERQPDLLDQAVRKLELRLGDDKPYTPSLREGKALFGTGLAFCVLIALHLVVQLLPYSLGWRGFLWWSDALLTLSETALPLVMAWLIPNRRYKIALGITGAVLFLAAFFKIFLPFL